MRERNGIRKGLVFGIVFLMVAVVFAVMPVSAGGTNPEGLVAYWRLNEGSGNIAYDSSDNDNDGTLINGPKWVDGISGKALEFDGVDDYVSVPDDDTLDITDAYTASGWFKCSGSKAGGQTIVAHGESYDTDKMQYSLSLQPDGKKLCAWYEDSSDAEYGLSAPDTLIYNKWYHAAVVLTSDSQYKLYLDGVEKNSSSVSAKPPSISNILTIGCLTNSGSHPRYEGFFNGAIDEVRVWNRALNASEIKEIYNSILSNLPDLSITSDDISFSNPNPVLGETITINATVRNIGVGQTETIFEDDFTSYVGYSEYDFEYPGYGGPVLREIVNDTGATDNYALHVHVNQEHDMYTYTYKTINLSESINSIDVEYREREICVDPIYGVINKDTVYIYSREIVPSIDLGSSWGDSPIGYDGVICGGFPVYSSEHAEGYSTIYSIINGSVNLKNSTGKLTFVLHSTDTSNIHTLDVWWDYIKIYANTSVTAIVSFYDGHPEAEGTLIGQQNIKIRGIGTKETSIEWTPTTPGTHDIYVRIEDATPADLNLSNNMASKTISVKTPILILDTGDTNIYRFKSGEERTIPIWVTCHEGSISNVSIKIIDDQGLSITILTPNIDMEPSVTMRFHLKINASTLKSREKVNEMNILIQAIGNENSSNIESLGIIIHQDIDIGQKNTPGFEGVILLIILLTSVFIIRKRKLYFKKVR